MKNTAEKMRETAKCNGSYPLKWFLDEISIKSNKGYTCLYLPDFVIDNNIKKILKEQGFIITVGGGYGETDSAISW